MTDLRTDLTERLVAHCRLMCVTGEEGPIADEVEARYRELGAPLTRVGHSIVVGQPTGQRPVVLLVGHLDVVSPTDADREPRVETIDGEEVLVARGASDMKAGNVVAMRLFDEYAARPDRRVDLALVLYAGEEGPAEGNELTDVLSTVPWVMDADLAVVLEPTNGAVHLGCLGGLHATVTVRGEQTHSARPWDGDNALVKAARLIATIGDIAPLAVDVEGVTYHDVWSVTRAWTDNGRNVIPGAAYVNLNFRFAPSRDIRRAEAELHEFVERHAAAALGEPVEVEIVDRALPAPPRATHPEVAAFAAATGAPVAGKQAWTDVARLAEVGVPALNFGPGRTDQAHRRGEYVALTAVEAAYRGVERYLDGRDDAGRTPSR